MADEPAFESVVTDEMRAAIGVESAPSVQEITTTSVRMFARSVGYTDPVFYDVAEAKKRGYRSLPAPIGYLGTAIWDPRYNENTFGGRKGGGGPRVQSPYKLVLNGGTDVEYIGVDICAGDTLTARSKLADLTERYSAALGSPMLIQTSETSYTNQDGKIVAITRGTSLSYGPKA